MFPDHTRVPSIQGPEFCCKECSTKSKRYVEWPCPAVKLIVYMMLGSFDATDVKPTLI